MPANWRELLPIIEGFDDVSEFVAQMELPPDVQRSMDDARQILPEFDAVIGDFKDVLTEMLEQSGMNELWPAVRQRIVILGHDALDGDAARELAWTLDTHPSTDRIMTSWLAMLQRLLNSPGHALLLDETISDVVSELFERGSIQGSGHVDVTRRSAAAKAGTGFLVRLPAFPQAPVDELLDLRAEVASSVGRYRDAVQGLAAGGLTGKPYSQDWDDQVYTLWSEKVKPSVNEIEDVLTESTFVKELSRSLGTEARFLTVGASGLAGFFLPSGTLQTALSQVMTPAGTIAGASLAAAVGAAARSRSEKRRVHRDGLSYLVQVNRELSKPR